MQLRTFRGKTMAEALTAVKRELGADALIVHTRFHKIGGVLGVGAREEVEVLASPMPPAAPAPPRTRPHQSPPIAQRARAAYTAPDAPEPAPSPRPITPASPAPAPTPQPKPEVIRVRPRQAPTNVEAAATPVARLVVQTGADQPTKLHEELGAIREMVAKLLSTEASFPAQGSKGEDPLSDWYLRLLSNSVSRELVEKIISDVRRRVGEGLRNPEVVRDAFRECIASHIRTSDESVRLPQGDDPRPRTIAVVGATGVGKTTTVAKLAAQARLTRNARVGMITCDTNRIGAVEQLRTYADIVGSPFRVAATPCEMREARRGFADTDLLLIDTPGLSPRDADGIASLAAVLDEAGVNEVHLALPASGAESSLLAACRAFAALRPSRLLFTKLDEAVTYGVILSVASAVGAEVSYLTTGPRIPEQIEKPDPFRLADLIAAA